MNWANERPIYVDPPSGWMYGFPKLWDGKTPIKVWLVENGYPEKMANENKFVRFISAKAGKEDDTACPEVFDAETCFRDEDSLR